MSSRFILMVEIELPDDCDEVYQDAMVKDMTEECSLERLENLAAAWVRRTTGEECFVEILIDE